MTTRGERGYETTDAVEAAASERDVMSEWLRRTEEWFSFGDWRADGGEQEFVLA